ncbi:MAG: Ppx/GppA phosphatase [Pedosphaera sp.]|nr:Ppx/GppA phosphatase [Pedosphaera sp.]
MPTTRRAVIDVGTNSIKLLVADVREGAVEPVWEDSEQTRLGAGFYATNRLQPESIAQTAQAVATFAAKARELQAVATRVIATSAARDAVNPAELTAAIERAAGLKVEIISGEQEAGWGFQGVNTNPELARHPLLLMDVGGGSTEFILGEKAEKQFGRSFQLGTVRLLEKLPHSDPPTALQLADTRQFVKMFLENEVRPELEPALARHAQPRDELQLVGTGGTATILARMAVRLASYDRRLIESARITQSQLRAQVENLWTLSLAERKKIPGLPESRADVVLTGIVIYEAVMEAFGFTNLRISTRGLRFAAVMGETNR